MLELAAQLVAGIASYLRRPPLVCGDDVGHRSCPPSDLWQYLINSRDDCVCMCVCVCVCVCYIAHNRTIWLRNVKRSMLLGWIPLRMCVRYIAHNHKTPECCRSGPPPGPGPKLLSQQPTHSQPLTPMQHKLAQRTDHSHSQGQIIRPKASNYNNNYRRRVKPYPYVITEDKTYVHLW